jgi:hypothetical protein
LLGAGDVLTLASCFLYTSGCLRIYAHLLGAGSGLTLVRLFL